MSPRSTIGKDGSSEEQHNITNGTKQPTAVNFA